MHELTNQQKSIYYLDKFVSESVSSLCWGSLFNGFHDTEKLNEILNRLVEQNDALRIRIASNVPKQYFEEYSRQDFPVLFFESEKAFDAYAKKYAKVPMALTDRLYAFSIICIGDTVGLLIKMHHIIIDAAGIMLLHQQIYDMLNGNRVQAYSYKDYINRYASDAERQQKDTDYFVRAFNDRNPRRVLFQQKNTNFEAQRVQLGVEPDLTKRLQSYAQETHTPLYSLFLAALGAYVGEPVSVGLTQRNRIGIRERATVGLFVNTIPLIIEAEQGFQNSAEEIQNRALAAIKHVRFDFWQLEKTLGGGPLYDVLFDYEYVEYTKKGYEYFWYPNERQYESLQIHLLNFAETGQLVLLYDYQTNAFTADQITTIHHTILDLLEAGIQNPGSVLDSIRINSTAFPNPNGSVHTLIGSRSGDCYEQLLHTVNDTAVSYDKSKSVCGLIHARAGSSPDRPAVIASDRTLSYAQLWDEAGRVAKGLVEQDVRPGDIVAFCLPRDSRLLCAMLGILQAGAAYLPLDPGQPQERLAYILKDSGAKLCVKEENYDGLLETEALRQPVSVKGDDLCYCIYTSGSTGMPKGTLLTHQNVLNYIWDSSRHMFGGVIPHVCETILSVTSVGFDIFVTESLLSLANGKSIILANERQSQFGTELQVLLKEHRCDVIQTTPSKMHVFLQGMTDKRCLQQMKCIVLGGEMLDKSLVEQLKSTTSGKIYNVYGPTEATVWATYADIDSTNDVTIGKPLANTQIYIVDKYMQPVPIGVTGELCIAGDCVGQGYLNRPELTEEKFVENPFGEGKLYKTGDLAYWREDGNIVFVGRNDFQVKINGQRIEPGEVEATLSGLEGIESAAVIVKEECDRKLLCAFYTGRQQELQELRNGLQQTLPGYMVPQAFTHLEQMPLTTSGKIDRTALQDEPVVFETEAYEAPVTAEEKVLAAVIADVLDAKQVGRNDNFFSLGGDSIRAIHVTSELQGRGYALTVADLMRGEALRETALRMQEAEQTQEEELAFADPTLQKEELDEIHARFGDQAEDAYSLSPAQEGIYAQTLRNEGKRVYHLQQLIRLSAEDPALTKQRIAAIAQRHAALRAAFVTMRSTGRVLQVILKGREPEYRTVAFDTPYSEETAKEYLQADAERPFDLEKDALLRVTVLRFQDTDIVLCAAHHIVTDGWSMTLLSEELLREGTKPERVSFARYVRSLRKADQQAAKTHWEQLLQDAAPESLFAERYGDVPSNILFETLETETPAGDAEQFAKRMGVTVNTVFESAFGLLLQRYSGADEAVFCKAVSGRSAVAGTDDTVGPFLNTVPVRVKAGTDETGADFLRQMQRQGIEAEQNGILSLANIYSNANLRGEDVDALFAFENYYYSAAQEAEITRLRGRLLTYHEQTEFPLTTTVYKQGDVYKLRFVYNPVRFGSEQIGALAESYRSVLRQLAEQSDAPLGKLSVLPQKHREKLHTFNDTAVLYDKSKSIYDLFEEQLHRNGQACIRDRQIRFTFAQLSSDASRIDAYIRQKFGAEKQVIGVLCDRSYAELVAIFGVIRGGNAYLPISPQYPAERIRTMLETSGCRLVLAQKEYVHLTDCAESVELVLAMQTPDTIPAPAARPEDTLYVIYTSGSTGTPKGAMVSNRSAVNRIQWMANRYYDTSTVVMRKTPYTFDVSVWEIFGFAMFGFSLYILPPDAHYNQNEVLAHIEKGQVTDLHFVPTVFEQFLVSLKNTPDAKQKLSSVRHVILSGESLLAKDVNAFRSYHDGHISIHNLYGPAECAVDVTAYDCAETEVDPIPIGRPIANTQIYIVDRYMQPVPIGVTGELCIAGDCVGQGYLNRPELTEEKFVENPFGEGKLYKTGDLAYWREDGNIVFVGRNDFQVKINGQRIEPGEVEATLSGLDGIESAAVVVKEESDRKLLCAFYTGRQQEQQALRNGLQQTLPVYMVPQAFTHLEQMPLTTSGKIDRKALLSAAISVETYGTQYEPPQTPLEERICQVFCDILDVDRVGRGDSFYDLGGTSLDMIRLLCCDPLSALTPEAFMKDPTPASLAQKLIHDKEQTTILQPLYLPQHPQHALVLFPYAGGDASAYTALIAEARKQNAAFALYYVHWLKEEEFPVAAQEIRMLAKQTLVTFYSHCAGAVIALKLLDILNQEVPLIPSLIAGGNILPAFGKKPIRIWKHMTDGMILSFLKKAGLPLDEMPEEEVAALINRFRKDTDLFFDYIQAKTVPTPISVHLVLSKHDLFTQNYKSAASRWAPYVSSVQSLYYIDSKTHYFQAKDADLLFDYLTKK